MTRVVPLALAILLLTAAPALAEPDDGKGPGHAQGKAKGHEKHADPPGHARREAAPEAESAPAPAPEAPAEPAPTQAPAEAPPHDAAAEPAPAREHVRAPTPVPERRIAAMEEGLALQARATVAIPQPYAAAPDREDGSPVGSIWTWALPILGIVGIGAALAGTRPASVHATTAKRLSYLTATPNVEGLLRAGKTAVEQQRFEEAVAWFTQALKLDPRVHVAHFCMGVCLATLDRHDEAYAALRKAHRLDPREGAYRLELARAAARTGRHREAIQQMSPLLHALPDLARHAGDDDAFAGLRDHPRWLAMLGRL